MVPAPPTAPDQATYSNALAEQQVADMLWRCATTEMLWKAGAQEKTPGEAAARVGTDGERALLAMFEERSGEVFQALQATRRYQVCD